MQDKRFVLGAIVALMALYALTSVGPAYASPPLRDCSGATVSITSPTDGQTVSGTVSIIGSADLPGGQFRYYKLEFARAGTNGWVVIVNAVRRPVINGVLATVDASQLPPGDYTLRILAVDPTGNYCENLASIRVGSASDTPTPTGTPQPSETPNALTNPSAQGAAALPTSLPGTPTVVVDLTKNAPGLDSIFTQGNGKSALPFNPSDVMGTVGASAGAFAGQMSHQFIFGMQAMAGLFILLGVIVFLRENL